MFFFLACFTLYNRLQFHPPHYNLFKCILFNGWEIFHCEYIPQLSYPFICWWTSRLLPCPGYYKHCCDEHSGTHVSFNCGFLGVYAQQWDWILNSWSDFSRIQTKTMDLTTEQESKEVAQSPNMNSIYYFWKHGNPCHQYEMLPLKNRFFLTE